MFTTLKNAIFGAPQDAPIKAAGMKRSSQWYAKRTAFIKQNPRCKYCGFSNVKFLEVHHIKPFHLFPELELVESNWVVVCAAGSVHNCHLLHAHLGNFESYNPDIEADAKIMQDKMSARPKS